MADNEYTPVDDGFHNCKVIFTKRAEKHFGKPINAHVVFEMKLVPTDCPEVEYPAAYKAEFPVLIVPDFDWDFYDEKVGKGVWRKATAEDTKNGIDNAQRCFPAWKDYCDTLPEGSDDAAFAWFTNREFIGKVTVRAKLVSSGTYTGADGMEHPNLKARIYAPFEDKPIVTKDEAAQISNALKAAGVKLFGKPKAAVAAKPKAKTVDELREAAFAKYQEFFATDKTGAGFYPKSAEILKVDMNTWESWTTDDWEKIIGEMTDIPF